MALSSLGLAWMKILPAGGAADSSAGQASQ
jgi:hypothetical protein